MQMHGLTILQLHKEFGAMAKAAVGFIVQVVVRAPCVPRGRRAPALVGLIGFVRMHLFWARGRACAPFTWRWWRRMHTPRAAVAYHLALRVAHHDFAQGWLHIHAPSQAHQKGEHCYRQHNSCPNANV
jgi:hypothetical protein